MFGGQASEQHATTFPTCYRPPPDMPSSLQESRQCMMKTKLHSGCSMVSSTSGRCHPLHMGSENS